MDFNVITYFLFFARKRRVRKEMVDTFNDKLKKFQKLRAELVSKLATIEEEQKTWKMIQRSSEKKWQFWSWRNQ